MSNSFPLAYFTIQSQQETDFKLHLVKVQHQAIALRPKTYLTSHFTKQRKLKFNLKFLKKLFSN